MYDLITVNGGHSAGAPGASGCGYKEHEVARMIKNRLIDAFLNVGQRTADTTSDAHDKTSVLVEQVKKCNTFHYNNQLDVSIHLNAGGGTGVEVLYFSEAELAATLSRGISLALGLKNRGAKQRKDLYFLHNTHAPAVLIEICFIDCDGDMEHLNANMDGAIRSIVKVLTGKDVELSQDYTIRSGETLGKIAQRFNTTVGELLTINPQITNKNLVHTGQVIKIPRK